MQSIYIYNVNRGIETYHINTITVLTFLTFFCGNLQVMHDFNLISSTFPICFPDTRTMAPAWPRRGLARLVLVCGAPSELSEVLRSRILHADCRSISHRIHGTGIFTYIYLKNQPFMQVNIQSSHGSYGFLLVFFFQLRKTYWIQAINFDLRKSWSVRFTVFCGAPWVLA